MNFFEIWLLGSVAATVCCSLDYELRDKNITADSLWACIIFSWVVVGGYAGSAIAKRIKRAASGTRLRENAKRSRAQPRGPVRDSADAQNQPGDPSS